MSSIVIAGDTSGSVTLQAPAVSGTTTLTLPATSGTLSTSASQWTTTGNDIYYNTGLVGIGTSSPVSKLSVNATNSTDANNTLTGSWVNVGSSLISGLGMRQRGNSAGISGDTYPFQMATIGSFPFEIYTADSQPLVFGTNATERMRISSGGNILFGTTSSPATSGGGSGFINDGENRWQLIQNQNTTDARALQSFRNPNGAIGSIQTSGSTTSFNTSSDYRLKNTIAPMTGALAKVALLKPCTYKWNCDGSDSQGFIAHELAEVVPQCVTGEKDGTRTYIDDNDNEQTEPEYQGIDTSFLVATLTAAIQEQQALITTLTERITALEGA